MTPPEMVIFLGGAACTLGRCAFAEDAVVYATGNAAAKAFHTGNAKAARRRSFLLGDLQNRVRNTRRRRKLAVHHLRLNMNDVYGLWRRRRGGRGRRGRRRNQQRLHSALRQRLWVDQRNQDHDQQNRAIDDECDHHPILAFVGLCNPAGGFKCGIFKHSQPRIECLLLLLRHRGNRKCSRTGNSPYRSVFTLSEARFPCKTCC